MVREPGGSKIDVECTEELKRSVRVSAAERDVSMAQYIRDVLADETGASEE